MQNKTQQRRIIEQNAKRLDHFCWFVAIHKAGKETSSIVLKNGNIPIVPVVLWPQLGQHQDQVELSRLLAEMLVKSVRRYNRDDCIAFEMVPSLISYDDLKAGGFGWEEWQIEEVENDYICPHCGMVNETRCCADWQPKHKPKRKHRDL